MPGKTYRTRAVVIDKVKLKETDLILTLLADTGRQIRAVAKGARKPGARTAARCELFCTVDLLLAHGRNLEVVSQAELVDAPLGAEATYERLCAASAVAEVAKYCSFEDFEDPFAFAITVRALDTLGAEATDNAHLDLIVAAYVFKLLSHEGYRPGLGACVLCDDAAVGYFSSAAGGVLCSSCAQSVAGAEPIDAHLSQWLEALVALRFDELASAPVDAPTAVHLLALAHVWAATHLDVRLRALEFMLGC